MRHRRLPAAAAVALVLTLAACSSSSSSSSSASASASVLKGSGPVQVLYAGSLVWLMEQRVGPAFNKATGYTFVGYSAGSTELASDIKGGVRLADVFVSASPDVNNSLEGQANGDWVTWYATFASAPLVIGYNPHSRFANELKTKPWEQVVTQPGFLLGRTDPATDPKGQLAVQAIQEAAESTNDKSLLALLNNTSEIFPEETLVGRLQAGQLDAGFFYSSEAAQAGIPTVSLGSVHLSATYTVTVVKRAPDPAGGTSFVTYLLGPAGTRQMKESGLDVSTPKFHGTGVPSQLLSTLHPSG